MVRGGRAVCTHHPVNIPTSVVATAGTVYVASRTVGGRLLTWIVTVTGVLYQKASRAS